MRSIFHVANWKSLDRRRQCRSVECARWKGGEKIKKVIVIALVLLVLSPISSVLANDDDYYPPGLLFGKPFSGNIFALTDGDRTTSYSGYGNTNLVSYTFVEPVDIQTIFYHYTVQQNLSTLRMYDERGIEIYNLTMQRGQHYLSVNLTNVKQIRIYHPRGFSATYYAFEVYGDPAAKPSIPSGLKATPDVGKVKLSWNSQTAKGFNVYRNSVKLNDELITGTSFEDTTGLPETTYAYQISAENSFGIESDKSSIVHSYSLLELIKPTLTYSGVTDSQVRLEWDKVGNRYEVYQDGEKIREQSVAFLDVTKLTPNTTYEFYVRSIDRFGRFIDSDPVTVKTQRLLMKEPVLTFTGVTHNSFQVSWQPVVGALRYEVYLNGEKQSFSGTTATFENLSPDTIYSVRVDAINDDDVVSGSRSITTAKSPVPRIEHASVTPSKAPGATPTSRTLEYQPNDLVSAIKLYINGQLVGEFPADQREIEIDFADLQDALMADITIEPVDENGVPYNFKTPVNTTENGFIDEIIGKFLDAFQITRKAFVYLAICAVIFLILIVVLFFWLRRKFQGMFGKTKNFKGEAKDTKRASFRQAYKNKYVPSNIINGGHYENGGFKKKPNVRAPTNGRPRTANMNRTPRTPRQIEEKDKRYYQSFQRQESNFTPSSKVVNFNDSSNVVAFQERLNQINYKRRNRK